MLISTDTDKLVVKQNTSIKDILLILKNFSLNIRDAFIDLIIRNN